MRILVILTPIAIFQSTGFSLDKEEFNTRLAGLYSCIRIMATTDSGDYPCMQAIICRSSGDRHNILFRVEQDLVREPA
jgi:hypothetical protein